MIIREEMLEEAYTRDNGDREPRHTPHRLLTQLEKLANIVRRIPQFSYLFFFFFQGSPTTPPWNLCTYTVQHMASNVVHAISDRLLAIIHGTKMRIGKSPRREITDYEKIFVPILRALPDFPIVGHVALPAALRWLPNLIDFHPPQHTRLILATVGAEGTTESYMRENQSWHFEKR